MDAAEELAARYADKVVTGWDSPAVRPDTNKHWVRIRNAFLVGFNGQPNPYAMGRGGNFAAPLRRAFRAGVSMADECREAEAWKRI